MAVTGQIPSQCQHVLVVDVELDVLQFSIKQALKCFVLSVVVETALQVRLIDKEHDQVVHPTFLGVLQILNLVDVEEDGHAVAITNLYGVFVIDRVPLCVLYFDIIAALVFSLRTWHSVSVPMVVPV